MHAIFTSFFAYHFGYGPYSYLLNTYKLAELDLLQLMCYNTTIYIKTSISEKFGPFVLCRKWVIDIVRNLLLLHFG